MRANIILKLSEGMTPMEVVTAQSTSPKMVHRWPENIFFFFLVPTFLIRRYTIIVRLKRKLAEQEEELAIVKKAAAYFAKSLK